MKTLALFFVLLLTTVKAHPQGSCASPDGSLLEYNGYHIGYSFISSVAPEVCYQNMPGTTYCYVFTYPISGTLNVQLSIKTFSCSGGIYMSTNDVTNTPCNMINTSCTSVQIYDGNCDSITGSGLHYGACMTPGEQYTICITAEPVELVSICPTMYCSSGQCFLGIPIKLIRFEAGRDEKGVLLNWITGSETNNDHFEVQRSWNGRDFEFIGRIEGAGNSSSILRYSFLDKEAIQRPYYRLKQVDYNGAFTYSPVVTCDQWKVNTFTISGNQLLNPSGVKIQISGISGKLEYSTNQYRTDLGQVLPPGIHFIRGDERGEKYVKPE